MSPPRVLPIWVLALILGFKIGGWMRSLKEHISFQQLRLHRFVASFPTAPSTHPPTHPRARSCPKTPQNRPKNPKNFPSRGLLPGQRRVMADPFPIKIFSTLTTTNPPEKNSNFSKKAELKRNHPKMGGVQGGPRKSKPKYLKLLGPTIKNINVVELSF